MQRVFSSTFAQRLSFSIRGGRDHVRRGGRAVGERERERDLASRKTKSEKRSRGESVAWWKKRASCSVYSVDGGGGERRIARMLDLMLKWRG